MCTNPQDPFIMAVINYDCVVGRVPMDSQSENVHFLRKYGSVCVCEIIGAMVNQATGFGLKIPFVYLFYGNQACIERFKNIFLYCLTPLAFNIELLYTLFRLL